MRIGVELLGSGAQADDVEAAIDDVARAYGVGSVQAAVTFAMITVSRDPGSGQPITLLHFVRDRTVDFGRLAAVSTVVRRARRGGPTPEAPQAAIDEVERRGARAPPPRPAPPPPPPGAGAPAPPPRAR